MENSNITDLEHALALNFLKTHKVAVFIVAYNAEKHLDSVVKRIPEELIELFAELFIIDDSSTDETYSVAKQINGKYSKYNFNVYQTPFNRGYGGNQKLGYLYCIEKKIDYVVLLHGDGQYAPEYLTRILAAFDADTDAVFASRMINRTMALHGGMPIYKWCGNQVLTCVQNKLLGTHLSEFHTGFRAYRVESLKAVPFIYNSDEFHFDTEIIIQAIASNWKIKEVAIPTHYGEEKCHVNGIKYAYNCIKSVVKYHLVNLGLFYERNYDFAVFETDNYQFKTSPNSLHQYILKRGEFDSKTVSVELGANRGILSSYIADRVKKHMAIDILPPDLAGNSHTLTMDLNCEFSKILPENCHDCCVALDLIEHLNEPEKFLADVFRILRVDGHLYISTANIGYLPIRLMLLLGQFNYGKRGILDKTHKRLFTISSFLKLLTQHGFKIKYTAGFAPPLTDLINSNRTMKLVEKIHTILSRCFPKIFAYNFLVVASRMDDVYEIFTKTIK